MHPGLGFIELAKVNIVISVYYDSIPKLLLTVFRCSQMNGKDSMMRRSNITTILLIKRKSGTNER